MPSGDEQNDFPKEQSGGLNEEHARLSADAQEVLHVILELLQQNAKEFHTPAFLSDISEFRQ